MSVCAVIVTYHPDIVELEANFFNLRPQVEELVVVDNASGEDVCAELKRLTTRFSAQLIENGSNLGIAEALNQGIRFAITQRSEFVLFFDQDSKTDPDFVVSELACYKQNNATQRIGVVTPTILKLTDGRTHLPVRSRNRTIILAQTSGALSPLALFEDVGLFRADMFIDYVDYEHNLRMLAKGWTIAHADSAILYHLPGNGTSTNFFGRRIVTVGASPVRHYYETRNCLWLFKRYFHLFPEITTRLLLRMLYVRAHALVFEPKRLAKSSSILHGAWDGLRGCMGARKA
jgi:rhamnosyltransferase